MWEENVEIQKLNNEFRDFYNDKISSKWDENKIFKEYMQQACGFVTIEWHNIICSVMDAIDDTSTVINEYKQHWLWERHGEKLIRLYGLLNAIYCQKTAVDSLSKILWTPLQKEQLDVIDLRNIITHITDVEYWKKAYQFTHHFDDEYIWLPEHTNRWNSKKYNIKESVVKYENFINNIFKSLIRSIQNNHKTKWKI